MSEEKGGARVAPPFSCVKFDIARFGPWVTLLPNRPAPGKRVQVASALISAPVINRSTMANGCSSKARLALIAAVLLSGCANGGAQAPALSLPTLPSVGSISDQPAQQPLANPASTQPAGVLIDQTGGVGGSATDIYSRLASGAMKCWFAVGGPLKKDYVYHATADPASRGGKAQIVIHERDTTQPNPRGLKSYVVNIEPTGENSATVRAENLKMTDAFAGAMTNDVARWTKGEDGCSQGVAGWTPSIPQETASATPAAKAKAKRSKKAKAKHKTAKVKAAAQPSTKAAADD
jgi:hypothetical protein